MPEHEAMLALPFDAGLFPQQAAKLAKPAIMRYEVMGVLPIDPGQGWVGAVPEQQEDHTFVAPFGGIVERGPPTRRHDVWEVGQCAPMQEGVGCFEGVRLGRHVKRGEARSLVKDGHLGGVAVEEKDRRSVVVAHGIVKGALTLGIDTIDIDVAFPP